MAVVFMMRIKISYGIGIPLKNEDEWPGMKVFVDELLVMSSGIALFFVHFSKLLAEKDSQEHRTFLSVSNF
uniref:Uncharacterized protein n=1 Tax=Salix viminalis TaxID=40686 RepID=A0A6N2K3G5_SALVM